MSVAVGTGYRIRGIGQACSCGADVSDGVARRSCSVLWEDVKKVCSYCLGRSMPSSVRVNGDRHASCGGVACATSCRRLALVLRINRFAECVRRCEALVEEYYAAIDIRNPQHMKRLLKVFEDILLEIPAEKSMRF
jgi:hypothetical protein